MKPAFFLIIALVVGVGLHAHADVASEARFFDDAGRRAYGKGQYEQALESFQLAQEISPSPQLLYNIALCADLAGRRDMAFSLYTEYLKGDDADAQRRQEAEGRAQRLRSKLALVEVASEPPGAAIYVDRKELGQFGVTPITLAVSEGEHHLLLERPGFAPADLPVTAKTGAVIPVHAPLAPVFGRLVVNVTPGTARLTFLRDGVPIAAALDHGGYRLQIGRYQVRASAPSYTSSEAPVAVSAEWTAQLDFGLVPLPQATGLLLVNTGSVSAEVFVDGRRVAVTPATVGGVRVGAHTVEVKASGRTARRSITITEGRPTYVEVELGGKPP
jgi:hypothetical protein